MRGIAGLRILLVVVLLFTMLTVVSGFELFNSNGETTVIEMVNKITVQDSMLAVSVEEVSAINVVGLKQTESGFFYNNRLNKICLPVYDMAMYSPTIIRDVV